MKPKPTIDELEAILNAPDGGQKVSILPSGEIVIHDRISELETALAAAEQRAEKAERERDWLAEMVEALDTILKEWGEFLRTPKGADGE